MYNNNNLEFRKFLFLILTATGKKSGAENPSGWIYKENEEKYQRENRQMF